MALPANVRINPQLPFPSLIRGTGPITIGKANGIWQVGFTISAFGSQTPPIGNYPTDYVLAYDAVAQQFFKVSLSNLLAAQGGARNQRSITATPIVIASTDMILNCKVSSGAAACTLPSAATRNGIPLTFKDLGQASAHNITLTAAGSDTIDGTAAYVIKNNFGWVTLVPFNDSVNTGWSIQ